METPSQLIFELESEPGMNFTLSQMESTEDSVNAWKTGWPGNPTNLDTWLDMTS